MDRVDDEGRHGYRRDAARREREARPRAPGQRRGPGPGGREGPGRLRRGRQAAPARAEAADHAPASADAHGGICLRDLATVDRAVPDGHRHARHHDLHERGADDAAAVRSRRSVGVRDQHRLGRQDGRGRQRQEARPLLPGPHLRSPRDEGHLVQALALAARAARERAPAGRQRARSRRSSSGFRKTRSSTWAAEDSTAPPATI